MLSLPRKRRETGFTLIELLTVIIIIGILAAVAIPVFSAQRGRANDAQVVSDVRNIVTSAETYLADRTKSAGDITGQSVLDYTSSANVKWDIKGNATTGGYCIVAFHSNAKTYNSTSSLLSYDSTAGGLKSADGSCGKKDANGNVVGGATKTGDASITTPTPTSSTAGGGSGSSTPAAAYTAPNTPVQNNVSTAWYTNGNDAFGISTEFGDPSTVYVTSNSASTGLYKVTTSGPAATTLNSQFYYASSAKIGNYVYGVSNGNIYRLSPAGSSATSVYTGGADYASKVTAVGSTLYLAFGNGKVVKYTPDASGNLGTQTIVAAATVSFPRDLAYNAANDSLYLSNGSNTLLTRVALSNGNAVSTLATTNVSSYIGAVLPTADGNLIITSGINGSVQKVDIATGVASNYATVNNAGGPGTDLATDGTRVYVAAPNGIWRL